MQGNRRTAGFPFRRIRRVRPVAGARCAGRHGLPDRCRPYPDERSSRSGGGYSRRSLGEKLNEIVEKSLNEGNKDETNIIIDGLLIKISEILSENKSNNQLTLFLLHLLNILSNSILFFILYNINR